MDRVLFDVEGLRTPCFVVDEARLQANLTVLQTVAQKAGCKILLAQKAFSMFAVYPMIGQALSGTTASGLYEAKLGKEEMGGETHIFSPAYRQDEFTEILTLCDHLVFNSFSQWHTYREQALAAGKSCGLRINPECSTQDHGIYDPCAPFSRLGIPAAQFHAEGLQGIEGLHFHTLCEQGSDALLQTIHAVEEKFGAYLPRLKWVNFGGGHHITKPGYDIQALVTCVREFSAKYGVQVYLEPGEAVALNAGYLVTTVQDIVHNGIKIAILDTSAACHMPDVLEMPYRPPLFGADKPDVKPYAYRLTGPTCLAGDVIGDYSLDEPLKIGDRLMFEDMAIYTMVKTNTFNGMRLPDIVLRKLDGCFQTIASFGYQDFKIRLS